jgi:amidohydrolase
MLPALHAVAGRENVQLIDAITGAEDFSFFAEQVPGFFFFLGGKPLDKTEEEAAPHHTPDFYIDESGLELGVRTLANMTLDYMRRHASP